MNKARYKKTKGVETEPESHFKRNVLLACIPVVGSIIIALISQGVFSSNSVGDKTVKKDSVNHVMALRAAAGKINQYIISRQYEEVRYRMSENLKPLIPSELFMKNIDSVENLLGHYTRTLDTSHSTVNSTDIVVVKNRFQNGIHLVQIIFDNNGHIYGLFSLPYVQ